MSLWGVPVTVDVADRVGHDLVANLAPLRSCRSRNRPPVRRPVWLATTNQVRILAEERLAYGAVRPTAIVKITTNGSA